MICQAKIEQQLIILEHLGYCLNSTKLPFGRWRREETRRRRVEESGGEKPMRKSEDRVGDRGGRGSVRERRTRKPGNAREWRGVRERGRQTGRRGTEKGEEQLMLLH